MNDEISIESANQCVDGLVAEIHRLQEPKTPTKEQIIKIHRSNKHLMSLSHYTIELIINEWEKIRGE